MSTESEEYTLERLDELTPTPLYTNREVAEEVIENASGEDVIRSLVEDHGLDKIHDGEQGIGIIRRAILQSDYAPSDLKQRVATRGDSTTELDVLVPETVENTAKGAIEAGKPVVLYGPTGTGKTTFAKQLALETSIGYTLETASPSWTSQDIVGRVVPDYSDNQVSYRKELGCVSRAVDRARDFEEDYSVIIDELTRADISKIFGPLYTAIENPHQTIFQKDNGDTIELDPDVNIICTMNMSDRTVNQLDNAITRRFAMIEVSSYERDAREELFAYWTAEHLNGTSVDSGELQRLFHADYRRLNGIEEEDGEGIMKFGPMHYEDVALFIGKATAPGGVYEDNPELAVGEAFRTYIVPRLLNAASYSQVDDLVDHYTGLDEEFDFDLARATELVKGELRSEQQRMGA